MDGRRLSEQGGQSVLSSVCAGRCCDRAGRSVALDMDVG